MDVEFSTIDAPASRDYVLAVLIDDHRQQCQFDPVADPDVTLTLESTVADWREACDLVGWRPLGRAMNAWWRVDLSDDQWRGVLEPAESKSLNGVCELIAANAVAPTIRPATFFGRPCRRAAAFLTVRSLLRDAGADVAEVRPTTLLHEYTRNHLQTFLGPISRLAPGALPDVKIETPEYDAATRMLIFSWLFGVAGFGAAGFAAITGFLATPAKFLAVFAIGLFVVSWLLTNLAAKQKPASVQFGELQTFADLAALFAACAAGEEGSAGPS